jgi:small-conductance mechanosensitive channel
MEIHSTNNISNSAYAIVIFIISLIAIFFLYNSIYKYFKRKTQHTEGVLDDFILELFRIPILWLIYWILLKILTNRIQLPAQYFSILEHFNSLFLIFTIAWINIQLVKAGSYYLQSKLSISEKDNLNARKNLTQINVFRSILKSLIIFIALSVALLSFEKARTIGLSLLTSAGILGIIIGFAAQKSIGMILAGIQLAITQPIKIDDVVIVEGEWGNIEEISLTFVVVKIWDERRLILPVNYFLEKPFQNWTKSNSDITGSIFIYVDYSFNVDIIREILPLMLQKTSNWDNRIMNIQVTDTKEHCKVIRVLLSSSDASKNWDLRTEIREELIDYISTNHPEAFAVIRHKSI